MTRSLSRARSLTHQVLGQPHHNVVEELIRECETMRDSLVDFEAWNSGRNVTNPNKVPSSTPNKASKVVWQRHLTTTTLDTSL